MTRLLFLHLFHHCGNIPHSYFTSPEMEAVHQVYVASFKGVRYYWHDGLNRVRVIYGFFVLLRQALVITRKISWLQGLLYKFSEPLLALVSCFFKLPNALEQLVWPYLIHRPSTIYSGFSRSNRCTCVALVTGGSFTRSRSTCFQVKPGSSFTRACFTRVCAQYNWGCCCYFISMSHTTCQEKGSDDSAAES